MSALFRDRTDAGRRLAELLARYRAEKPLVLALPRGGVPVAYEIARALEAPMDVWVVRKIGAPGQPDLGMGAVAERDVRLLDRKIIDLVGASQAVVDRILEREAAEVEWRVRHFRPGRPSPDVRGRTVILVDDGIATGGTVRAAIRSLRQLGPRRLVVAVPVGPADTLEGLRSEADDVVAVEAPPFLDAIGAFYADFAQVSDEAVLELLGRARGEPRAARRRRGRTLGPGLATARRRRATREEAK